MKIAKQRAKARQHAMARAWRRIRPWLNRLALRSIGARKEAMAAGNSRYFGKICVRHPEEKGERRTRSAECVRCGLENKARRRVARRQRLLAQAQQELGG